YDWAEVQREVDQGASLRTCMQRFGFSRDAWGKAVKRGDLIPKDWVTPIEELLVAGRRRSRGHVKGRLIGEGIKENRCERCFIAEWRGEPLNMALHHVNGDGSTTASRIWSFFAPTATPRRPTTAGATATGAGTAR